MGIPLNSDIGRRILEMAGEKATSPAPIEERISEKEFTEAVKAEAKKHGWRLYHTFDSRKSEAGFPDLVMLRATTLLVAELKVGANRLTAEQENWIAAFRMVAARVFVWRPSDWPEIVKTLEEA